MTTRNRIPTSYFISREAAFAYYALQGEDKSVVSDKIADGLVKIGKPPILLGERLLVIDNGCRYAIEYEEHKLWRKDKPMDPDTTLREIRTLLAQKHFDRERLCELVRALDEWLTKGGTLPLAWDRDRKA